MRIDFFRNLLRGRDFGSVRYSKSSLTSMSTPVPPFRSNPTDDRSLRFRKKSNIVYHRSSPLEKARPKKRTTKMNERQHWLATVLAVLRWGLFFFLGAV